MPFQFLRLDPIIEDAFELPQDLAAALHAHCVASGERPADVLADALALHLDALEASDDASETIFVAGEGPRDARS